MIFKSYFITLLLLLFAYAVFAQYDSVTYSYSFIQYPENYVQYPDALNPFFKKLHELQKGERKRVNVVHIGDSHLQAGYVSEKIMDGLQIRFGNAGRGLIFPYKVAGSNSPSDITSQSTGEWTAKRCVFPNLPLPIGIAGYTVSTTQHDVYLRIALKDRNGSSQYFDEIKLFHKKGASEYDLKICYTDDPDILNQTVSSEEVEWYKVKSGDYLGRIAAKYGVGVSQLKAWNHLRNNLIQPGQKLKIVKAVKQAVVLDDSKMIPLAYISSLDEHDDDVSLVKLNYALNDFYIKTVKSDSGQNEFIFYGAVLSNSGANGVLYNMIGANGAMVSHYNQAERFQSQLSELEPDLVIVSLGTNEAHSTNFSYESIMSEYSTFISNVKANNPDVCVLLTSPPETHKPYKYVNPNSALMADLVSEAALNNGCALWNFYKVMGGNGAMRQWQSNELGQTDRVHLTRKGYYVQGQLLFDALMSAYDAYPTE